MLDGDLSKLSEPGGRYVAAVYSDDDYGNPEMDSHWARLGDTVTLRYVEEFEYYNPNTGEVYGPLENVPAGANYVSRAVKYRDVEYEVAALVVVPRALSYRYYGADEFLMLGGALSFIVGLVGVLNFFNAILTGITVRKREFAVLQSIGMTGKQLKTMLVYEGLLYALGAVVISLVLAVVLSPLAFRAVGNLFWFFTYRFTISPILIVAPIFALLGILVPLAVYRSVAKSTIVERLREAEA